MDKAAQIKAKAASLGFDACGIARAGRLDTDAALLRKWLDGGLHASLGYMAGHFDMRADPRLLVEGARSMIVCLISYKQPEGLPTDNPRIASYARCADYHYTVKAKLSELLDFTQSLFPGSCGRVFTDSAPVMERSWAVAAGLGWRGRNTMLINPRIGSFTIIGTVVTDADIDSYDAPYTENHCVNCGKCVAACPTGAIRAEGTIDAARCISYHTIENRGSIPDEIAARLDGRIFGCDTCQSVCPYNSSAPVMGHAIFRPVADFGAITAEEWLSMGSGEFRRRFGCTPLSRCGLRKIKSTAALLLGHTISKQKEKPRLSPNKPQR